MISALLARAAGIEQKITKAFCHGGQPGTASYIVQLPRDGRACIFWLRDCKAPRRPRTSLTLNLTASINDQPTVRCFAVSPMGCSP